MTPACGKGSEENCLRDEEFDMRWWSPCGEWAGRRVGTDVAWAELTFSGISFRSFFEAILIKIESVRQV